MSSTPAPGDDATPAPTSSDSGSNTAGPTELTRDQQVIHYVDMWKQSVQVQMHFNDIEWRIRGLALTVATFALGAAGIAAKDGTRLGWVSLGSLVILIGLLLWYAFYFVDRVWYHPLLKAAVAHGTEIENEIKKSLPVAGMTATITARSEYQTTGPVRWLSLKPVMHSDDKLVWFYKVGAVALATAAVALQVGVMLTAEPVQEPTTSTPSPPTTSAPHR